MHAEFKSADFDLMASDRYESHNHKAGNNVFLSLNMTNKVEMKKYFDALKNEGEILMDLQQTHWGATFGMLKDKFSICWMFNAQDDGSL